MSSRNRRRVHKWPTSANDDTHGPQGGQRRCRHFRHWPQRGASHSLYLRPTVLSLRRVRPVNGVHCAALDGGVDLGGSSSAEQQQKGIFAGQWWPLFSANPSAADDAAASVVHR
jgi:hypothetical protein